jgi:tetratricopeptide (TPR) repeat protein
MKFFDELYPYEIILLVLGVLLFLVLIVILVVVVMRGKPYGTLLMSFAIPIVMIGFPGINSIEISKDLIAIKRNTDALHQNPTDKKSRDTLTIQVARVSARPLAPQDSVTLARAQLALGDNTAAEMRISNILKAAPQLHDALELKNRIELERNLIALASQVEQNPTDAAAKAKLAHTVKEVTPLNIANPKTIANVAHAQALLGEHAKAQANVDKALEINPNLTPAIQLRKQLKSMSVSPVPVKQ